MIPGLSELMSKGGEQESGLRLKRLMTIMDSMSNEGIVPLPNLCPYLSSASPFTLERDSIDCSFETIRLFAYLKL